MSASDALVAVKTIYDVVTKVKDNKEELQRVSRRLEHIVLSIEDSRRRDVIREDEYNDALTAVSDLILRTQRISQRLLKRSLGDRTWNTSEIAAEIRRLNDDVQIHLSLHTIRTLDIMQISNAEQYTTLSRNMEEVMIKLAELDIQLGTRPGDPWARNIQTQAEVNIARVRSASSALLQGSSQGEMTEASMSNPNVLGNLDQLGIAVDGASTIPGKSLQALATSGKTLLRISGLKVRQGGPVSPPATFSLPVNASYRDVLKAIKEAGYSVPDQLLEEDIPPITITEDLSTYDASAPDGLQIARTVPLLWWWNKYQGYHGLAHATTPGHTIARINSNGSSVHASGVTFRFHRTLRVPDSIENNNLPPSLGTFPLLPVENYASRLPDDVCRKGGFIMPIFKREALWISFEKDHVKAAVKLSVGGVNAISGIAKDLITPPGVDQDYIVAGLQPWIDGVAVEPGVVRQFIATTLGQGYTVEEQVTGKAEIGGFQFDIFPRRAEVMGCFWKEELRLDSLKTPEELSIHNGETTNLRMNLIPRTVFRSKWIVPSKKEKTAYGSWLPGEDYQDRFKNEWTLAGYRRRVSPSAGLQASYDKGPPPQFGGFSSEYFRSSIYSGTFNCMSSSEYLGPASPPGPSQPKKSRDYFSLGGNIPVFDGPGFSSEYLGPASPPGPSQPKKSRDSFSFGGNMQICSGNFSSEYLGPASPPGPSQPKKSRDSFLGVSLGGKIVQKIYREKDSHRVYDEENGHRFYVHIVSPEAWEAITGVLPPITPINRDMYIRYKLPWFRLYDDYLDHLTTASDGLRQLQSVAQLDEQEPNLSSPDLINPDHPLHCPRHPRSTSSCVFRPCGHLACDACLGKALIGQSKCVECEAVIVRFVGIKHPIPVVTKAEGAEVGDVPEWNIEEMEDLAAAAADTNKISVLYFAEDRVPPLHSNPSSGELEREFQGSSSWM